MSATPPNKLAAPIDALLPRLELDGAGTSLLAGVPDAATGISRLAEAGRFPDALRLAAHALPKREAVWWACMCARAVPVPESPACDAEALTAAETWVRKPDEAARRATMEVAQRGGFRSPEAWAAVAAFWSGGSMAPEGQPVVPPADHLTGVAVAGAIILAATRITPEKAEGRFQRFLQSAQDIAGGGAGRLEPETP